MALVFRHADGIFRLLKVLVCRPAKGELSEDAKGRSGIPVVCLKGDEQGKLTDEMATALRAERPGRIPHEVVDLSALWAEVTGDRPRLAP